MPSSYRPVQWIALLVLLVYLVVLTKNIVFKKDSVRYYKRYFAKEYKRYSVRKGWEKANTVPFRTINMYYKGYKHNNKIATYNLLGNLLGFIPFGFLLPLAVPWFRRFFPMLMAILLLSIDYETIQLITGLGIFDVDDLLLNSTGALVGYLFFWLTSLLMKRSTISLPHSHNRDIGST
ncbi:MAG TPA: VanZ family protein [Chitinophagaceae bacterium]